MLRICVAVLLLLFAAVFAQIEYTELTLDATIPFNVVEEDNYRYFILQAESFIDKNILIFATPFSGDVELYASNTSPYPTATDYRWTSNITTFRLSEFITIPANALSRGASNVTVGVLGTAPGESFFSMVAIAASEPTTLLDGVAVTQQFEVPKYQFFKFTPTSTCMVSFSLTLNTTAGEFDANLYVSSTNQFPTQMDSGYKDERFGDKLIENSVQAQVPVYIGVKGYYASGTKTPVYTLTVGCKTVRVQYGKPVFVSALPNQIVQLNSPTRPWTSFNSMVFTVSMLSGDSKLYLSSDNNTYPVNRDNAMWKSMDTSFVGGMGHVIVVPSNDPRFSTTAWNLGVEAVDYSAEFMVTAGPNTQTTSMVSDSPFVGMVSPATANAAYYHYFHAQEPNDTSGLDVYIKVYQRYNLDVCISNDWFRPTPQNCKFKSSGVDGRIMNLPASQLNFGKPFYINVYGDGEHEVPYHIMICQDTGCKAKDGVLRMAGSHGATKRLSMKVNH